MKLIPPQEDSSTADAGFRVTLRNFEGPFDLLLSLINQRQLDLTEIALHTVTDDFIAYTRRLGSAMGLDQTTEFLVVAATLLDLKAARLLQYRAYKQVATLFGELEEAALRRYPRSVAVEDQFADLLPEVLLGVDSQKFAEIAATVFAPRPVPTVSLDHLHVSNISIPEQAEFILDFLCARGTGEWVPFPDLIEDCDESAPIVARFLALLELYRRRIVAFDQPEPLGPLLVTWTGEASTPVTEEDYR